LTQQALSVSLETTLTQIEQQQETLLSAVQDSFKGLSISLPQSSAEVSESETESTLAGGIYLTDASGNHMISFLGTTITIEDEMEINLMELGYESFD
jgi:hypothetical protein